MNELSERELLSNAVIRIAASWDLTDEALSWILGLSPATVSRLRNGQWHFCRDSKPTELAQYLVRLFRSLDSLMGSDDEASRSWLHSANVELGAKPIDIIRSMRGLVAVTQYVDGYCERT